jgi:Arc/MetJ-type ribon-helix-helix transcriptional regulator
MKIQTILTPLSKMPVQPPYL